MGCRISDMWLPEGLQPTVWEPCSRSFTYLLLLSPSSRRGERDFHLFCILQRVSKREPQPANTCVWNEWVSSSLVSDHHMRCSTVFFLLSRAPCGSFLWVFLESSTICHVCNRSHEWLKVWAEYNLSVLLPAPTQALTVLDLASPII